MTAAIYARVSTSDQDCAMQLSELRRYAAAQGFTVYKEYIDPGYSGKNGNRPALKACMKDAFARRFDILLVWKLDRWGRTVAQLSADILALDSAGIRFICPSQGIDTDKSNPMSRLMLNILSSFAQFERDMIVERVTAGVRHAQKHGTKSGNSIGRPKVVFNRGLVSDMRSAGKSWADVAAAVGQSKTTVRRAMEGV